MIFCSLAAVRALLYSAALMIYFKTQFISATKERDVTVITHDARAAIHDSKLKDGVITVMLPKSEAGLLLLEKIPALLEQVKEQAQPLWFQRSMSIPFSSGELCLDAREELWVIDCSSSGLRREIRFQVLGDSPTPPAPAQQRR